MIDPGTILALWFAALLGLAALAAVLAWSVHDDHTAGRRRRSSRRAQAGRHRELAGWWE